LAAGFCPKNLAFARKIMALPELGRLQPPPPSPLARTPMILTALTVGLTYVLAWLMSQLA